MRWQSSFHSRCALGATSSLDVILHFGKAGAIDNSVVRFRVVGCDVFEEQLDGCMQVGLVLHPGRDGEPGIGADVPRVLCAFAVLAEAAVVCSLELIWVKPGSGTTSRVLDEDVALGCDVRGCNSAVPAKVETSANSLQKT